MELTGFCGNETQSYQEGTQRSPLAYHQLALTLSCDCY